MDENVPPNFESQPPPPTPPVVPPPLRTPPPRIVPAAQPAPQPPRKSRGWMVVALLAIAMLCISLLFNLGHFVSAVLGGPSGGMGAAHSDNHYMELVVENNRSDHKIAVVDVDGVISGQITDTGKSLVTMIKEQLERAGKDDDVKAVILKVDSPGGEVLASDDIARDIQAFYKEHGKPVVVSMGSLAASGGYYVSAPCQWIVANELTITGSIGVIMESYNYRGLMDKVGVQPMVFKSGKYKDMLDGGKKPEEVSPEERQMVQGLIDETFAKFKQVVADGRQSANKNSKNGNRPLADDWRDYADGRILSGKQAYDLGFVDELGNFSVAVERAKKLAGIDSANLVRYQPPFDISNIFRLFGKSEARSIKVDLGMDRPKLQVGRLYFMSTSVLH